MNRRSKPCWLTALLLASLSFASLSSAAAATPFDREVWRRDYEFLKTQLERTYANLAWFASPSSGVSLPELDARTVRMLAAARSDDDAKAAILAFVAGFHDGHLQPVPPLQPASTPVVAAPRAELDKLNAIDGCAALGYAPARSVAFSLPFESLAGSSMLSDGVTRVFRASIATSPQGARIGIVRIPRFRPQDAPPTGCVQAWQALQSANKHIDVEALRDKISDAWFETLATQLKEFRQQSVVAVLVDVGGNTGGNDSGDWTARLFTTRDVHSARLLMAAAPSANGYFDEELTLMRNTLKEHPNATEAAHAALNDGVAAFERRKASIATRNCDLSWAWRQQKPWEPAGCSRLVEAGFASGQADYLPSGSFGDKQVASSVYWAAAVDPLRGAWSGPTYILTDDKTASSAEMFSAVMQDNGVAKIIGIPTEGDGCGFMLDEDPLELPHSHLRFRIPNCVRLRADGTNEVAGVKPDLPIQPTQGEDARARAWRVLGTIDGETHRVSLDKPPTPESKR